MASPVVAEMLPSPWNCHSYLVAPFALARIGIFLPASTVLSGPAGSVTGVPGGGGSVAVGGGAEVAVGVGAGVVVAGRCVGAKVAVGVGVGGDAQPAKPIANSRTEIKAHVSHFPSINLVRLSMRTSPSLEVNRS